MTYVSGSNSKRLLAKTAKFRIIPQQTPKYKLIPHPATCPEPILNQYRFQTISTFFTQLPKASISSIQLYGQKKI